MVTRIPGQALGAAAESINLEVDDTFAVKGWTNARRAVDSLTESIKRNNVFADSSRAAVGGFARETQAFSREARQSLQLSPLQGLRGRIGGYAQTAAIGFGANALGGSASGFGAGVGGFGGGAIGATVGGALGTATGIPFLGTAAGAGIGSGLGRTVGQAAFGNRSGQGLQGKFESVSSDFQRIGYDFNQRFRQALATEGRLPGSIDELPGYLGRHLIPGWNSGLGGIVDDLAPVTSLVGTDRRVPTSIVNNFYSSVNRNDPAEDFIRPTDEYLRQPR